VGNIGDGEMGDAASRLKGPVGLILLLILALGAFAVYDYRARAIARAHAEVAQILADRLQRDVQARDETIALVLTGREAPSACVGTYREPAGPKVEWKDDKKVFVLTNELGQAEEGLWDPGTMRIVTNSGAAIWFAETGTLAIYQRATGIVRFWKK
jgi:hypothetical protein